MHLSFQRDKDYCELQYMERVPEFLLMGLFLYAAIHWKTRDDRDGECLRHTKYDDKVRSTAGIVIEVSLGFAVIRGLSQSKFTCVWLFFYIRDSIGIYRWPTRSASEGEAAL